MAVSTRAWNSTPKQIKDFAQAFISDRKKSNDLLGIISAIEVTSRPNVLLAGIRAIHKIFQELLKTGELYLARALPDEKDRNAAEKYKSWLRDRYGDCFRQIVGLLHHEDSSVQELALCTLMKFVALEGEFPLQKLPANQLPFPKHMTQEVVRMLATNDCDMSHLIGRFSEYMEYDDVRYFIFKALWQDIKNRHKEPGHETYLLNVFSLLDSCGLDSSREERLTNMICALPDPEAALKVNSLKEHRKLFTSLWLELLRNPLSTSLYKKILVLLHEKVVPNFTSPLLLSDFLTESYNIGGAISLLALNGLFILIHKCNLDYPEFFRKLYALFEPSVFHVKYKARFFHLADLFLTSTHLPAYLVAAFVKRLSRISLTAPPSGLKLSIPFIYNLLNRHPSCKRLLHRTDGPKDLSEDPYDATEQDPAKCQALESSLWEIKTLQSHYYPDVAILAQKIDSDLPSQEIVLSDLLEITTGELFQKQAKKFIKEAPMNYSTPSGLFSHKDDQTGELWTLS